MMLETEKVEILDSKLTDNAVKELGLTEKQAEDFKNKLDRVTKLSTWLNENEFTYGEVNNLLSNTSSKSIVSSLCDGQGAAGMIQSVDYGMKKGVIVNKMVEMLCDLMNDLTMNNDTELERLALLDLLYSVIDLILEKDTYKAVKVKISLDSVVENAKSGEPDASKEIIEFFKRLARD